MREQEIVLLRGRRYVVILSRACGAMARCPGKEEFRR
jgi:hypothetical protein